MKIDWPEKKRFAFTVFDDTDLATLENVRPVYDLLTDLGFRTTKSVWPLRGGETPSFGGTTCEDEEYVAWLRSIQSKGFEIGYHMATYHSSKRDETIRALDSFRELFGDDPITMANHSRNKENIYWGRNRLSGVNRVLYQSFTRSFSNKYEGEKTESEYFWGDICKTRVQYVRNFVFSDINTLKACPCMPYHDADRPFVNYWYASSEGRNVRAFCDMISEKNQERLESEGGACIMYTHFGDGFCVNGVIDPPFKRLMGKLSKRDGWFVPVRTLLDFLKQHRAGSGELAPRDRNALERSWLWDKIRSK